MRPEPISSCSSSALWNEFRVFSYTTEGEWKEHCRGIISMSRVSVNGGFLHDPERLAERIDPTNLKNINVEAFYRAVGASGISYGPDFQEFEAISAGKGMAIAKMGSENTCKIVPKGFQFDGLMHPSTMDCIFQAGIAAASDGDVKELEQPFIPIYIKDLSIATDLTTFIGRKLTAFAQTRRSGLRESAGDIVVHDDQDVLVVRVSDLKCVALLNPAPTNGDRASTKVRKICVDAVWEPDVDLLTEQGLLRVLRKPLKAEELG